jgi:hypothetical protein
VPNVKASLLILSSNLNLCLQLQTSFGSQFDHKSNLDPDLASDSGI